jgi:DNA-binding transcriptional ArsR family regulator
MESNNTTDSILSLRMGEGRTTRVSKDLTIKYNIISDVIVSPTRLEILNNLIDSPGGLSYDELLKKMSEQTDLQRHLDILLRGNIIEYEHGKYSLSKKGVDVYFTRGKAAMKVKEQGLL